MVDSNRRSVADEVLFAAYILERRLAVGGMSEVFLARPRDPDAKPQRLIIKRLLPELVQDDSIRQAFELEAKLHAAVRHKNVVQFYDFGTYAGEPYIVMEIVEGVDLSRILRHAFAEERQLSVGMCVYVARELCAGLAHVHGLQGDHGEALNIVHCDVTPTNVLLSVRGEVKLADFGIARFLGRDASLALKGKYAYLAPEQVSGEAFDHRADLFAVGVVVSEMLIGGPLFPGAGQLAVLLAIRDARIDPLRAARAKLPKGLFEVLERALAKSPDDRYRSAFELSLALAPYELPSRGAARAELTGWVAYAADSASAARRLEGAVLETRALSAGAPASRRDPDQAPVSSPPSKRTTHPEDPATCLLRTRDGVVRPIKLPKIIEMLATGQLKGDCEVDFGDGFHPIAKVAMLARYLPPTTVTTRRVDGPGVPDYTGTIPESTIAEALAWIAKRSETGVLFADRGQNEKPRAELYFDRGKLVLASSSEPSTLLGEHLVSKGVIDRGELDLAVLVMHKYNGQLGDTIIALGLAEPMQVFQAIKSQGRERVAALFRWPAGQYAFYRGVEPTRNDFPLDLEIPALVFSGLSASVEDDEQMSLWAGRMNEVFTAQRPLPEWARGLALPPAVLSTLKSLGAGQRVRDLVQGLARPPQGAAEGRTLCAADVLRALDTALLLGFAARI